MLDEIIVKSIQPISLLNKFDIEPLYYDALGEGNLVNVSLRSKTFTAIKFLELSSCIRQPVGKFIQIAYNPFDTPESGLYKYSVDLLFRIDKLLLFSNRTVQGQIEIKDLVKRFDEEDYTNLLNNLLAYMMDCSKIEYEENVFQNAYNMFDFTETPHMMFSEHQLVSKKSFVDDEEFEYLDIIKNDSYHLHLFREFAGPNKPTIQITYYAYRTISVRKFFDRLYTEMLCGTCSNKLMSVTSKKRIVICPSIYELYKVVNIQSPTELTLEEMDDLYCSEIFSPNIKSVKKNIPIIEFITDKVELIPAPAYVEHKDKKPYKPKYTKIIRK